MTFLGPLFFGEYEGRISLGRMYVTGRRRHLRACKVSILLISHVRPSIRLSVRLSVCHLQAIFLGNLKILHRYIVYARTERFSIYF